jgi:hypothetical protein
MKAEAAKKEERKDAKEEQSTKTKERRGKEDKDKSRLRTDGRLTPRDSLRCRTSRLSKYKAHLANV